VSPLDFLITAEAWASRAGAEHHAPSLTGIIFPLVNFLIFALIIYRYALPPVRSFFKSRREEVLTAIQDAAQSKQKAAAVVQEYQGRLARLDQEIHSIQASLRADGEREKTRLLREADGLAVKINEDARFLADQEVKIARRKIREEMANQAEANARELVKRHLSAGDQGRLVEDFIHNIGQIR
jgi:F-type H+-transporting ATPase subunit b